MFANEIPEVIYTRFETFSSYTTIHDNNLRFYFLFLHAFQFLFQLFEEKFFKLKLEAVCCGNFVRQKKGKQTHDKLIDKFNDRLKCFFFFFSEKVRFVRVSSRNKGQFSTRSGLFITDSSFLPRSILTKLIPRRL